MPPLQRDEQFEDLPLHGHVERRRRLVRDQDARPGHERGGDHDALAQPAGQFVRVLPVAVLRVGDAHLVQRGQRRQARLRAAVAAVQPQRLRDLGADPLQRVEAGHRVLEHHGDPRAAHLAQLPLGQGQYVPPVEEHPAARVHARRFGVQAHRGQRGGGFTAAGLTDDGEGLTGGDGQVHPAHRVHGGGGEFEVDAQVLEFEDGCGVRGIGGVGHRRYAFGSATSRSASPRMLMAREVSISATPGNTAIHQDVPRYSCPSASMPPQVTVSFGTPRPR